MKRTNLALLIILLLVALLSACRGEDSRKTETATIAPATPPPSPTDTDSVQTQTVEIGEQRSPNEGGVLTDEDYAPPATDTSATTSTR